MTDPETQRNPSPAEQAIQLNTDIIDLRNQVLFDRVGEEGMEAMARHTAEQNLLGQLETPMSPEGSELASALEGQELDELSRDMFNGRSFDELDPTDQERARQSIAALRQHSHSVHSDDDSGLLTRVSDESEQLDNEVNRVFNDPVISAFKYRVSAQTPDEVTIFTGDSMRLPFPGLEGIQVMPEIKLRKGELGAETVMVQTLIDDKTQLVVDGMRILSGYNLTDDERREMEEWLRGQVLEDDDMAVDIKDRLERIKSYLENHLDPNGKKQRMGIYGLEDPEDTPEA
jgi:hypothetical protein